MKRQPGGKGNKSVSTSHINRVDDVQLNPLTGRHSEAEIISQLKVLALDPCRPQFAHDTIQDMQTQILKLRKVMALEDSEAPWRKRKLEQFVKDKLRPPSDIVCPNDQNIRKRSRRRSSHASSVSCLLNSGDSTQCQDEKITSDSRVCSSLLTFDDALPGKQVTIKCSILDGTVNFKCLPKNIPPTIDSDESVKGSNHLSAESIVNVGISNEVQCDGAHSRLHGTPRRSIRLLNFIGDHFQRKVVPVGPRFQADVLEWAGPAGRSILIGAYNTDYDNSKWLGTRVWPIQTRNTKTTGKTIGKGRPDSCCCKSPGSVDCTRCHILEERLVLQCDLGPAFFSWKFDEMGDQVSKMWSLKEQQSFESLVKTRPSSNGKSFLKRALKCFPNKNGKDIANYYFNVYIPHRMSMHTRSPSIKQVDTDDDDDDEAEDISYMGLKKKSEGKSRTSCNSLDVKGRYLRRIS